MKRTLLQIVFWIIAVLAAVDLIWIRGLFTWLILMPLVLLTGIANVALALWNREGKKGGLYLVIVALLTAAYVILLVAA